MLDQGCAVPLAPYQVLAAHTSSGLIATTLASSGLMPRLGLGTVLPVSVAVALGQRPCADGSEWLGPTEQSSGAAAVDDDGVRGDAP